MAKSKTVLLHCTLEDGKTPRQPGERASLSEALAKSLAGLGLVEILDPAAAKAPPASAPEGDGDDTGSGDAGADADADSAEAGKEDGTNG